MLRTTSRVIRGFGLRCKSTAPIRNGLVSDKVAAARSLGFNAEKDKILFMGTGKYDLYCYISVTFAIKLLWV